MINYKFKATFLSVVIVAEHQVVTKIASNFDFLEFDIRPHINMIDQIQPWHDKIKQQINSIPSPNNLFTLQKRKKLFNSSEKLEHTGLRPKKLPPLSVKVLVGNRSNKSLKD